MRKCIVVMMGFALLAGAQEKKEVEQGAGARVSKIVDVRHRDVREFQNVLEALGVRFEYSRELKVISLSGPRELVEAAAAAIQKLDKPAAPPKNIEITVYLLGASEQPIPGVAVPPELQAVTKQLKSVFSYQEFRLLDTAFLRIREGEIGTASGVVRPAEVPNIRNDWTYSINMEGVTVSGEGTSVVRIGKLRFMCPLPPFPTAARFETGIDFGEGQKVVVGKANLDSKTAMILVLAAKIID